MLFPLRAQNFLCHDLLFVQKITFLSESTLSIILQQSSPLDIFTGNDINFLIEIEFQNLFGKMYQNNWMKKLLRNLSNNHLTALILKAMSLIKEFENYFFLVTIRSTSFLDLRLDVPKFTVVVSLLLLTLILSLFFIVDFHAMMYFHLTHVDSTLS